MKNKQLRILLDSTEVDLDEDETSHNRTGSVERSHDNRDNQTDRRDRDHIEQQFDKRENQKDNHSQHIHNQ